MSDQRDRSRSRSKARDHNEPKSKAQLKQGRWRKEQEEMEEWGLMCVGYAEGGHWGEGDCMLARPLKQTQFFMWAAVGGTLNWWGCSLVNGQLTVNGPDATTYGTFLEFNDKDRFGDAKPCTNQGDEIVLGGSENSK